MSYLQFWLLNIYSIINYLTIFNFKIILLICLFIRTSQVSRVSTHLSLSSIILYVEKMKKKKKKKKREAGKKGRELMYHDRISSMTRYNSLVTLRETNRWHKSRGKWMRVHSRAAWTANCRSLVSWSCIPKGEGSRDFAGISFPPCVLRFSSVGHILYSAFSFSRENIIPPSSPIR